MLSSMDTCLGMACGVDLERGRLLMMGWRRGNNTRACVLWNDVKNTDIECMQMDLGLRMMGLG